MHFLQSENIAAGHALLLLTLEANKNIREKKTQTRLGFLLPLFIFADLSQTPGSKQCGGVSFIWTLLNEILQQNQTIK